MEKRNELYKKVGEALHLCQVLELYIRILISIFNDKFGSSLEQEGLILTEDKNTLGKLISELKKYASLDETGSKILAKALEKRNYISHHFFNQNVYGFSKTDKNNLNKDELKYFKKLSKDLLSIDKEEYKRFEKSGEFRRIKE